MDYIGFGSELVGPGVVYRGEYDSGTTYYYTETRRDIVEYSSTYYLASNPTDSGTSNWGTPGSSTDWEEFGAEFSSVATDVLFAQDVYANRTINIGSSAGNPVIALNSDFGNSNEENGEKLNKGLMYWKEGFGAKSVSQDFYKIETLNFINLDNLFI